MECFGAAIASSSSCQADCRTATLTGCPQRAAAAAAGSSGATAGGTSSAASADSGACCLGSCSRPACFPWRGYQPGRTWPRVGSRARIGCWAEGDRPPSASTAASSGGRNSYSRL